MPPFSSRRFSIRLPDPRGATHLKRDLWQLVCCGGFNVATAQFPRAEIGRVASA